MTKRNRKRTGRTPATTLYIDLYHTGSGDTAKIVSYLGEPGTRYDQQNLLRQTIIRGFSKARELTEEWIRDLDALNPTAADKARKRGLPIPEWPFDVTDGTTVLLRYRLYLNHVNPDELDIDQYQQSIDHKFPGYVRKRLPQRTRQMFWRLALLHGIPS